MLRNLPTLLSFIVSMAFTLGCDELTLNAEQEEKEKVSLQFTGISGAQILEEEGTMLLYWSKPKGLPSGASVQYKVYVQELTSENEVALRSSMEGSSQAEVRLGERNGKLVEVTKGVEPSKTGNLVKVLTGGELSYEVPGIVPTVSYAFQVEAVVDEVTLDGFSGILLLERGILEDYAGCLKVEAVTANDVKIDFEYAEGADLLTVYRNGNPIHVADGSSTVFIDSGTSQETVYTYTYESRVGNELVMGSSVLEVKTPSAVDTEPPEFSGLDSLKITPEGHAQLVWRAATDNLTAKSALTYEIFRSLSPLEQDFTSPLSQVTGSTSYVDDTVTPGVRYYYTVRAKDNAANTDDNLVELSEIAGTPVKFAGVATARAVSDTRVQIDWEEASGGVGALFYKVYLNGDVTSPVAITTRTSQILGGLEPGTNYTVSVQVVDAATREYKMMS